MGSGPQKFWMVWNSNGRPPRKRYNSRDKAAADAALLADKEKGRKLYVLEAVEYHSTGEPKEGGVFDDVAKHGL